MRRPYDGFVVEEAAPLCGAAPGRFIESGRRGRREVHETDNVDFIGP